MSISAAPSTASIAVGATQQLTATATYSDGSTANVTATATWTAASTAVATVNSSGLATAVAAGSTTVTATLSGVSGTATITVSMVAPTLKSIAVTPASASIATGATQQLTATATYSDGSTANITTTATWTAASTAVATVNSSGLATAVAAGSTTVTATLSGVSGTAVLTVTGKAVSTITVTPNPASFPMGTTQQFTATAKYADGSTGNVTATATWSIANQAVATVNTSGLASGIAAGSSTITATLGGVAGSEPFTVTVPTAALTDVLTWHFDKGRTGLNPNEASLSPSNVSSQTFGKLFSYQVDGYIYGEPVIKSNVTIGGVVHNVVYVATENDSVYAFDADNYGTGAPLWQVSLLQSGETPLTNGPVQPLEGVTSTPVIDPVTNTIYMVSSQTSPTTGSSFRLHALDITTGAEKFGGPVKLNVSVAATNSVTGVETLTTSCIQRAALLLANGNIYMGFSSCHSGWLVAYSASTLAQVGVFNSSVALNGEGPFASAGGIWMGAGGPVADTAGNVYVTTGNGPWNGTNAWADSFLKFPPTPTAGANGTMQPSDYFTPSIYQYMDCNDSDLASGGLLLMPGSNQLLAGGKTGTMYVVNSANLGHESANDAGVTQMLVWGVNLPNGGSYTSPPCLDVNGTSYTAQIASYEIFGTSAFYNNSVYLGVTPSSSVAPGGVRQFNVSPTGMLTPSAISLPTVNQGTRGTSPFISSSGGTTNGIVWMIDQGNPIQNTNNEPGPPPPPTNATLYAYKADQFPAELYDSSQNAADLPGYGIKFTSPVVVNGKVYISTAHDPWTAANPIANPKGELDVYGLK